MPIKLAKTVARLAVLVVAIVAALWVYRAHLARSLPELQVWHTHEVQNEFRAKDFPEGISFYQYKELEKRLFDELDDAVYYNANGRLNRYNKASDIFPGDEGQQWNRSFELHNDTLRGGVLFIHGASDSPYSTRSIAKLFNDAGMYVLSVRLPGNGTIPSGLRDADLDDWLAITKMGADHVRETIGVDLPLYIAGYSVGGALAVDYAIDSLEDESLHTPARLFLYTPAIGVSAAARFSSWDLALSKLPVFGKFAWLTVEAEFDPYKFNSFAKNAGHITYLLTERLRKKFTSLTDKSRLPPVISFQSLVDSTIKVDSLVNQFYKNLAATGSELVLFDINRADDIEHFMKNTEQSLISDLEVSDLPFHYTLVTNTSGDSNEILARTRAAGKTGFTTTPLNMEWPNSVYSLSHVSLPFKSDDRWYGGIESSKSSLGTLAPRGETAILRTPIARFMRLRYNPFFDYLAERTLAFCAACEIDQTAVTTEVTMRIPFIFSTSATIH
jgi:alpha-beta hydrolase superfamily lysophospholipase